MKSREIRTSKAMETASGPMDAWPIRMDRMAIGLITAETVETTTSRITLIIFHTIASIIIIIIIVII
jgi:predicted aspartyl protease